MNRSTLSVFVVVSLLAGGLYAQQKTAPANSEKSAEKSKPLIFQPGAKLPETVSEAGVTKGDVIVRPAGANPILDGPQQIVTTFFAALKDGKIDEGYATLTKGSKIAEKPEELRQLKAKTREAIEVFGSINDFDFVESRSIGKRLVRATYVSLGKVFPLRWRFYFYKTEDVWRLIDMRVDDKLTGIFDEPEDVKTPEPAVP
jgi:hypothetical protein